MERAVTREPRANIDLRVTNLAYVLVSESSVKGCRTKSERRHPARKLLCSVNPSGANAFGKVECVSLVPLVEPLENFQFELGPITYYDYENWLVKAPIDFY